MPASFAVRIMAGGGRMRRVVNRGCYPFESKIKHIRKMVDEPEQNASRGQVGSSSIQLPSERFGFLSFASRSQRRWYMSLAQVPCDGSTPGRHFPSRWIHAFVGFYINDKLNCSLTW